MRAAFVTITGVTRACVSVVLEPVALGSNISVQSLRLGQEFVSTGTGMIRNVFMNCIRGSVRMETVVPEELLLPDRQTDTQRDTERERETDRQTDRQPASQTARQAGRQTHREREK